MPIPGQRKIAHIDMDCFYAAVEMRDNPSLRGKPLAVGSDPNKRGVLCTCNYEARKFGIRSAMPSSTAIKNCPQLIIVPVDMPRYKAESIKISEIIHRYTDRVEPLSLDEAYMDFTDTPHFSGSATLTVQAIRKAIFDELQLTASGGVAPNKFLAKIASDWKKPNGFFAITPDKVDEFVKTLAVGKIPGIGKVMESRLHGMNLRTCDDLQKMGRNELVRRFGGMGFRLFDLSRGIDDEPVVTNWVRKSLSVEDTFEHDVQGAEVCMLKLEAIYAEFMRRLSRQEENPIVPGGRNQLFVKIKYGDFRQTTIERAFPALSLEAFQDLFLQRYGANPRPVRLLGLGIRWPDPQDLLQIQMDLI
jgi:DNA polymerase-4